MKLILLHQDEDAWRGRKAGEPMWLNPSAIRTARRHHDGSTGVTLLDGSCLSFIDTFEDFSKALEEA